MPMKKKKSHADLMAEIAAEEEAAKGNASGSQPPSPTRRSAPSPSGRNSPKKKSHADIMAEHAAEEALAAKGRKLKKKDGDGSEPPSPTRRSAPPKVETGKKSHAEIMSEINAVSAFDQERKDELRRKAPKHSQIQSHRTPSVPRHMTMGGALGGFTASEETHLQGWESPRTAKKHADEKKAKTKVGHTMASRVVKKDRFGRPIKPKAEEAKKDEGNSATKLLVRHTSAVHAHPATLRTACACTLEVCPEWGAVSDVLDLQEDASDFRSSPRVVVDAPCTGKRNGVCVRACVRACVHGGAGRGGGSVLTVAPPTTRE